MVPVPGCNAWNQVVNMDIVRLSCPMLEYQRLQGHLDRKIDTPSWCCACRMLSATGLSRILGSPQLLLALHHM